VIGNSVRFDGTNEFSTHRVPLRYVSSVLLLSFLHVDQVHSNIFFAHNYGALGAELCCRADNFLGHDTGFLDRDDLTYGESVRNA
jgi:hypothetical protein